MYDPSAVFYMEKLVTGPEAADVVDIRNAGRREHPPGRQGQGLREPEDVTVVLLDRPRHADLVDEIRATGARIKFIIDGDVAGAIMAARPDTGIDLLLGIGGTPEGIIAACAMKCMGGVIQGRLWPQDDDERQKALDAGHDLDPDHVLTTDDLVTGDDCFFVATGITDGELMRGVRYRASGATTHSLVMRSRSGTIRSITSEHRCRSYALSPRSTSSTDAAARRVAGPPRPGRSTRGSTAMPSVRGASPRRRTASGSMQARQSTMPSRLE